jgi:hypothetical protein
MKVAYSLELYQTGKYRVVTRNGHKAYIEATEPELLAKVPSQLDCTGKHRYGLLSSHRKLAPIFFDSREDGIF